jgi:hypothetical protein
MEPQDNGNRGRDFKTIFGEYVQLMRIGCDVVADAMNNSRPFTYFVGFSFLLLVSSIFGGFVVYCAFVIIFLYHYITLTTQR